MTTVYYVKTLRDLTPDAEENARVSSQQIRTMRVIASAYEIPRLNISAKIVRLAHTEHTIARFPIPNDPFAFVF